MWSDVKNSLHLLQVQAKAGIPDYHWQTENFGILQSTATDTVLP